ncbi:tetratricopeptide repeat protein [Nodosilinea sp. PGN35]|uniref:tetratricopeptide repeat protein n=1 Tax=Nodosilinea sp. PGN35 TaxID=3020489 RepID=UPI0023B2194A|nr:tetratricopeptide repeat protein [Nodosilinea sp. TSF1-S3]MDF0366858.1 tetratricopeptide repeat protein [Nodosilinea sp. TSF1-S3]
MPQPYISRPEAETFLAALGNAIEKPQHSPVVFHLWGIGGVGKSTLLRQVAATFPQAAIPLLPNGAPVSFGQTEGIANPADLMKKLHGLLESQFLDPSWFGRAIRPQPDPFAERYTQYFDAIHQLNTTAPDGKGGASPEQLGQVKQLLKSLTQGGGALATATGNPAVGGALVVASKGTDAIVDGATLALSEKDRLQSLVQSHQATRDKRDLQALLLDPLPHLTQAFVKSLSQWAEQKPILLILDTYEKADLATIDLWLWRTLLSNTDLGRHRIRLVVAGRYNLLQRPEWATVQQNVVQQTSDVVYTYGPEKFTLLQTQLYLFNIGIEDPPTVVSIFKVTKGWPYYLNKIRETPNLDASLLTQDLAAFLVNHVAPSDQSKARQLAQVAACCRWFDGQMIEALAQQLGLGPPGMPEGATSHGACLEWLREQTFVEPMSGGRWRLDDVARDVFRMALWQEDRPRFERTHDLLARYFKAKANQAVTAATPTSEKYENPDWLEPMAGHLYHLTFTPAQSVQRTWLTHILESTLLEQPGLVRFPLQGLTEDYALNEHQYLAHATRSFLQRVAPAIEYGWAVLEETPIDYAYNKAQLGLGKAAIDQAVETCLKNPDQFDGTAKFAAFAYNAMRCSKDQATDCLQKAQAQAQQLLAKEPANLLAEVFSSRLGYGFYKAQLFDQAIACYDVALAIKADSHESLSNKGLALFFLGIKSQERGNEEEALAKLSEGIACYDAALAIKADSHESLSNKGLALFFLGIKSQEGGNEEEALAKLSEGIACYDAALAIKADSHESLSNKGLALFFLGIKSQERGNEEEALAKLSEGIAYCDAALAIKADYPQALLNKGLALSALGRKEDAITCCDAALAIKADYPEALFNKGLALYDLGRKEDAIACYDAALAIKVDSYEALFNKGLALYDLGRKEEAIACYDAALAIKANSHEALNNKGVALSDLGRNEDAIACYDAALAIKADLHEALQSRGNVYFANGELEKALADFDRALELQPSNQPLTAQRALVLLQMGDSSQLATAQQAIAATMADPALFERMQRNIQQALTGGLSETQQQVMQQVIASLNPGGEPLDAEALQAQMQDYQEFIAEYQELIQKSPEAWGHFTGACTAMMSDDIEAAINQLQAAIALVPEYRQLLQDDPVSWPDELQQDERFRSLLEGA